MNKYKSILNDVEIFICAEIKRLKNSESNPKNKAMMEAYANVLKSMGIPNEKIVFLIASL